jgi:hypothetical protein
LILKLSLLAGAVAGEKTQVPVFGPKTKTGTSFPIYGGLVFRREQKPGFHLENWILFQSRKHQHIISCILAN